MSKRQMPHPIEAIKFRMEQYDHTQSETSKITGINVHHLSEVLNYKRKLSLDMIRRFHKYGVPANALIQDYDINNSNN